MDQDALSLMERRLSRLRAEHEYRLLFLANGALDEFDPTRKVTFTTSLKSYAQAALEELSEHSARTRAEVTSLVNRLLLPLSVETKARVFALFARCFDESLYLEQFDIQECWRRLNIDHPCRLNFDQGRDAVQRTGVCG